MSDFQKIIKQAKDFYFNKWRGNENVCPAFNEKVYVTRLCWNHILYHKRRLLVDKLIRLKKLPLAKEILDTSTTYQTKKRYGKYVLYGFRAIKEDTVIKVVVSSKGEGGKKELYSVMFKNTKRQEQRRIWRHNDKIIKDFRRKNPRLKLKPRRK